MFSKIGLGYNPFSHSMLVAPLKADSWNIKNIYIQFKSKKVLKQNPSGKLYLHLFPQK